MKWVGLILVFVFSVFVVVVLSCPVFSATAYDYDPNVGCCYSQSADNYGGSFVTTKIDCDTLNNLGYNPNTAITYAEELYSSLYYSSCGMPPNYYQILSLGFFGFSTVYANFETSCANVCIPNSCNSGFTACTYTVNGQSISQCVDTQTDFYNCGKCNDPCSAGQACVNGGCINVGFQNCVGLPYNNIAEFKDSSNRLSYYNCSTNAFCSVLSRSCSLCSGSLRNCNLYSNDQCETDTNTNKNNCGGCGNKCLGIYTKCSSGVCTDWTCADYAAAGMTYTKTYGGITRTYISTLKRDGCFDKICVGNTVYDVKEVSKTSSISCGNKLDACYCTGTCIGGSLEMNCNTNDNNYCPTGSCSTYTWSVWEPCDYTINLSGTIHDVKIPAIDSLSANPVNNKIIEHSPITGFAVWDGTPSCYTQINYSTNICTNPQSICTGTCYSSPADWGVKFNNEYYTCGVTDGICPDMFTTSYGCAWSGGGICKSNGIVDPDCYVSNCPAGGISPNNLSITGCRATQPLKSNITNPSWGYSCFAGTQCYVCNNGYRWDNQTNTCVKTTAACGYPPENNWAIGYSAHCGGIYAFTKECVYVLTNTACCSGTIKNPIWDYDYVESVIRY